MAIVLVAIARGVRAQGAGVVRVVDEQGKAVAGATVQSLKWADIDLGGRHASLVVQSITTNAKGEAVLRQQREWGGHFCLLAFYEDQAVFVCHTPVRHVRRGGFKLTLGPARRLGGRVVDEEGKPLGAALVRLRFPGGYEWHGIDGRVGEDGVFVFPPMPSDVLARGARLQARAPRKAPFETRVEPQGALDNLTVRLHGTRTISGRVVDEAGRPVGRAELWFDKQDPVCALEKKAAQTDGSFLLKDVSTGAVTLHILSKRHALRSVPIPAGKGRRDLGKVVVAAGKTLKGRLREFDGVAILHSFVALETADGVRVRSAQPGPDGSFELPGVAAGPHRLDCWVHQAEGVGGSRHLVRHAVRAGGPPLDIVVPEGVRIRLVRENGSPCAIGEGGVVITSAEWSEPWMNDFQGTAISEVRLLLPPEFAFDLAIRVQGYREKKLRGLRTDSEGRLSTKVVLTAGMD